MILARKFSLVDDGDYERLAAASGRLRALLEAFAEDRLPPAYGPEMLAGYARSLLAAQRPDGSFSSHADPESLDADARTDAHRFVTWAAAAYLGLLAERLPEAAASVDGLEEALDRALSSPAAADFSFPESGPAEPVQQVEAALILASGGIPRRLRDDAAGADAAARALADLASDFRDRLAAGDTVLPGGIDYRPLFEQALSALEDGRGA